MKRIQKWLTLLAALVFCLLSFSAFADGLYGNPPYGSSCSVKLIDNLATRSGPGTQYNGCGSFKIKGQYVTALSRSYDKGGVLWVEIEFSTGKGYRRAWTGAKRLNISVSQLSNLPDGDPGYTLGTATITGQVSPRMGPDTLFAAYSDQDFYRGTQVTVLRYENDYYLVERYRTDGQLMRSYVPAWLVSFN